MRDDWLDQFRETSWERNERLAAARRASRCKTCGGNPRIGVPHKPDCVEVTPPVRSAGDEDKDISK